MGHLLDRDVACQHLGVLRAIENGLSEFLVSKPSLRGAIEPPISWSRAGGLTKESHLQYPCCGEQHLRYECRGVRMVCMRPHWVSNMKYRGRWDGGPLSVNWSISVPSRERNLANHPVISYWKWYLEKESLTRTQHFLSHLKSTAHGWAGALRDVSILLCALGNSSCGFTCPFLSWISWLCFGQVAGTWR